MNEYQKKIVDQRYSDKTILVDACPGSGKTYTVENVVAELVADESRVGVFTFSKKAAEEMRVRIAKKIFGDLEGDELQFYVDPFSVQMGRDWIEAEPAREMLADWCCTIHALSYRLLKSTGLKPRVLAGKEAWHLKGLIKDRAKEIGYTEGWKPIEIYFNLATINLVDPEKSRGFFNGLLSEISNGAWHARCLAELYQDYIRFCKARALIDFAMMQAKVIKLIRTDDNFAKKISRLFDYVIIDEAQDTSPLQMEIINAISCRDDCRLMMVGDVDQSMYAFRGARPEVLLDTKGSRFILPINYRSTVSIIESAGRLIANNYLTLPDLLKPFEPRPDAPSGYEVETITANDVQALGNQIALEIQNNEIEPGDIFILNRTRAECALIHTELLRSGIPAINKSGGMLFGAPHIRKVIAYARLGINYLDARDNLEILSEVANVATKDFVSPITRRNHHDDCKEGRNWVNCGCPIIQEKGIDHSAARYYGKKSIEKAGNWKGIVGQQYATNRGGFATLPALGARDLVEFVLRIGERAVSATDALLFIIEECVMPWLAAEEGLTEEDPAENGLVEDFNVLLEIVRSPEQTLEEYLIEVDQLSNDNPSNETESVLIGTFHWSKGAERPVVFSNITRCPIVPPKAKEGRLPTGEPAKLEEERRLIYVGVTRAKERAYIAYASTWENQPVDLQFLREIQTASL